MILSHSYSVWRKALGCVLLLWSAFQECLPPTAPPPPRSLGGQLRLEDKSYSLIKTASWTVTVWQTVRKLLLSIWANRKLLDSNRGALALPVLGQRLGGHVFHNISQAFAISGFASFHKLSQGFASAKIIVFRKDSQWALCWWRTEPSCQCGAGCPQSGAVVGCLNGRWRWSSHWFWYVLRGSTIVTWGLSSLCCEAAAAQPASSVKPRRPSRHLQVSLPGQTRTRRRPASGPLAPHGARAPPAAAKDFGVDLDPPYSL